MIRRVYMVLALALVAACGDVEGLDDGTTGAMGGPEINGQTRADALQLAPEVQLIGLGDVFEELEVTHLSFDAELFLLPEQDDQQAASVAVRYIFEEDGARTELSRPLGLAASGRYQLLVRIRPGTDDGVSVRLAAALDDFLDPGALLDREKEDEEPAPTPAEPAPTPAEPAPTPADLPENPLPTEPAPTPAEPAPTPAEPFEEPAPTPAEPAPTPAAPSAEEPAPTPARGKGEDAVTEIDARDTVFVRSTNAYEFYAGTVEIGDDASTLMVTWDVRRWLRGMLAAPLGMQTNPDAIDPAPTEPGFTRPGSGEFRITAQ